MTTTATTSASIALATTEPVFTGPERMALAGFLAGYAGLTREAYALDLRQFAAWCRQHDIRLFAVRRADIECFARDLEARGRARATVPRRLCTIAGFYRYAVEEDLLDNSPAIHVRRPRLDYESHATGLDRNEVGALLVAGAADRACADLPARLQRAPGLRGNRSRYRGYGPGTPPPDPDDHPEGRQARDHSSRSADRPRDRPGHRGALRGPDLPEPEGRRLDRHSAGRVVRRVARRAGITKNVGPHDLRHECATVWTPESRCGMCRKPPRTPTRAPPCGMTGPGPPWTGTPPTSSLPSSPEPPD
jgi:integrase/recombinase XerD